MIESAADTNFNYNIWQEVYEKRLAAGLVTEDGWTDSK